MHAARPGPGSAARLLRTAYAASTNAVITAALIKAAKHALLVVMPAEQTATGPNQDQQDNNNNKWPICE